jgi:two-component system, OmpR family, KDP operon response regulator KdpE
MSNRPLILLVEDELAIRRFLRLALTSDSFRLVEAETGSKALLLATQQEPDLVILDLGLPDMDGQDLLRQFREWLRAPIIILSARNQEKQKIEALDSGADDYLTKPFSTGELLARIRVALRNANRLSSEQDSSTFAQGDLRIDFASRRVFACDKEVHLTPLEYKLLSILVRQAGKVLTHSFLLKEVWGRHDVHEMHYLRVHMANLRRKIERDSAQPQHILTEQGIGYRLAAD